MKNNESDAKNNELGEDSIEPAAEQQKNPIQKFWTDRKLRSSISESCFSFSETIVRPAADRGANVIGFIGEKKHVGNSTIALFSSIFNAMTRNVSTVLVDCNFRRPVMKNWFEIDAPSGISDAMEDLKELEIATRATTYKNLSVIHSGTDPIRIRSQPEKLGPIVSSLSMDFANVFVDLPTFEQRQIPLYSQVDLAVVVGDSDSQSDQRSIRQISETLSTYSVPFAGVYINERPR